ncbi:TPA: hypothetical protein NH804_006228 [Pseudomonas aeruginosa]|uniref:hypothetical protein n=1 Tax=Pseudomonas aeruginosa TaxID=287 RepID=UPI00053E4F32|nr:hypothetical protein [Pseudomonas aeruginosa]EKX0550709.1 hypothetical protein [Pseudomonas aeruginosa]HCF1343361.1 hypothetical protein [Pseudomonas aeruginosa]HCF7308781.1 hypothetical protein [Pseudomonas aeruginosa]
MNARLDDAELQKVQAQTDKPKQNAQLRAERNRWFVLCLFQVFAVILAVAFAWYGFKKAENNTELVYVKLYPDGTSDVDNFTPDDEQLYFRSTIDQAFETYIKSRYGQQPETIKRDFGMAGVFMSQPMYNDFVSTQPGGFNAAQKAADISINKNSDRIEIEWGFSDHYDKIPAVFDKKNGEVIRSNIYFTRITKTATGLVKPNGTEKLILRAQWRLLPKKELSSKKKTWLRVNPVGVEIVQAELIEDPSSFTSAEAK